jgi:hypothetical protein
VRPEQPPVEILSSTCIVVEGPDEKRFYEALCRHHGIEGVQFIFARSKDDIRPRVRALAQASGHERIRAVGIIRDDDGHPDRAFASASDGLAAAGWPKPQSPGVIEHGTPCTGVMLVGGNLDVLCRKAVSEQADPRAKCVDAFMACVSECTGENADRPKAWVHGYLAAFGKGDVRVGEGAERGAWPLDNPAFGSLRRFLADLAVASAELSAARSEHAAHPSCD